GISGFASNTFAVYGYSQNATGVKGASAASSNSAVWGSSGASSGIGVCGSTSSTNSWAIYGLNTGTGKAGYFSGDVQVVGTLSKTAGSFKIDHPLDPANKYLVHSFVESPDMMNVYNGIVALDETGRAWVTFPDWFEALNYEFRYQL